MKKQEEEPITQGRAAVWIVRIVAGLALTIVGLLGRAMMLEAQSHAKGIEELRIWQARTESNRFTSEDGLKVWREIAAIREQIAGLPREVPPKWFVERVDRIEARQAQILDEIAVLRQKVK
jgi:Na+/H+ antiporter NhaB